MKFSVLLSVYIKEQPVYLRKSLDSIFGQTLPPDEVVLVQDGSLTDALDEIVLEYCLKYPVLKTVPLSENVGLGRALNEGLKHCSHELIARMDADDVAKPERFEKQLAVFRSHPEVDVVGAWIEEFEGEIRNVVSIRKLPERHWEIFRYARSRCPENHPAVMFRKPAVMNAGGYMHFPLFEDYYLWIRMLMGGACFYNIPESLLSFRLSPDMYKRRGGWEYALNELRFQRMLYRQGFIGWGCLMKNIFIRVTVKLIPNRCRELLYKDLLRRRDGRHGGLSK